MGRVEPFTWETKSRISAITGRAATRSQSHTTEAVAVEVAKGKSESVLVPQGSSPAACSQDI